MMMHRGRRTIQVYFSFKHFRLSELKTLEWDILNNPDYLIWVSNGHTFDFLLNRFFLEKVEKNQ